VNPVIAFVRSGRSVICLVGLACVVGCSSRTVTIELPPGVTELTHSLHIPDDAEHVIIRGNGTATLSGGFTIEDPSWTGLEPSLLERLPAEAQPHVRMLVLPSEELARWPGGLAGPVHSGHAVRMSAAPTEVFIGRQALRPARWPNEGWASIRRIVDPGSAPRQGEPDIPAAQRIREAPRGGTFVPENADRLDRWVGAEDAWMLGYWNWDWSDEQLPVAGIDPDAGTVTLGLPHRYGLAQRGRFAVINVLAELDEPGECWIDRRAGVIVAWLPSELDRHPVTVSMLTEPLIRLPGGNAAPRVTVEDVAFAWTRGPAIAGSAVTGATIDRCRFGPIGTRAVSIDGDGCSVRRSAFADIGGTGVHLVGGDRPRLVPGRHVVEDCTFLRCGRLQRTYAPAIEIDGVGHAIRRNEIADLPHIAIIYGGNEHLIEANLVHHVVQETGDAGAICIGRDWTAHGTVLRGNLVHDIAGTDARYQNAFYVDDMASGITLERNLVVRCNWGMLIGGGRDDVLLDNAFVACGRAVMYDARGVGWMASAIADPSSSTLHRRLAAMPILEEPWRSRYPSLQGYLSDRFGRPVGGVVQGCVLQDTPLGTIEDRACVKESGTVVLPPLAPAELRSLGDALVAGARHGTVTVGHVSVGPVGPRP
jgi:hypothetical protein